MASPAPYRPRRTPRSEFLTVRSRRLHLLRWGPADIEPILMLHGFLDTGATFQFLVDELPEDWSCAALDWRGFGDSDANGDCYWFPDYFADLDGVLDALYARGSRVRLIGHSMGGNVAMIYAGLRPERIRWVVSLDSFGLPATRSEQAPQRYIEWLDAVARGPPDQATYENLEGFAEKLRARNPRLTPERALFIAHAWTRPNAAGRFELRADPWHRLVNPVLYRREEAVACWKRIVAPLLLVLAGDSDYFPRLGLGIDQLRAELPAARTRIVRLPNVGHMMHHEAPAALAELLRAERAALESI
ncbi:MAG: alpha/beta hydrolase [Gammaproteobacteria bacterium]|nr:alpha/beta hydrolase [Gammaproteobacteria bacterium]